MKIVAQRDDRYFLLSDDDDPMTAEACVFDRVAGVRYPEMLMQSILAQGYWKNPWVNDRDAVILEALSSG